MSDENEKSEEELNAEFRRAADQFIDLANSLAKDAAPENIGMALLYAASRYNAFVVTLHAETLEKYQEDHERALSFFSEEYQRMLAENLQDYAQAFDPAMKYTHLMKKH